MEAITAPPPLHSPILCPQLVGFIALLLTVLQDPIANICGARLLQALPIASHTAGHGRLQQLRRLRRLLLHCGCPVLLFMPQ